MNSWLKRLLLILCSGFFFPISCTLGTVASLPIIQQLDKRDMMKGDSPHSDFFVLLKVQDNGNIINHVRLWDLDSYRDSHPAISFHLDAKMDVIEANDFTSITYKILEQSENGQTIEATLNDDDGHVPSRYKARGNEVVPLYSEGYFKSYAFIALRNGIALAFILYFAGKLLNFYLKRKKLPT